MTPLSDDGEINRRWCKTRRVTLAEVSHGEITARREIDVGWDQLHDDGPDDDHHERMARFLRDQGVNIIVVDHIGHCLGSALFRLDVAVHAGARGEVREAIVVAAHRQLAR